MKRCRNYLIKYLVVNTLLYFAPSFSKDRSSIFLHYSSYSRRRRNCRCVLHICDIDALWSWAICKTLLILLLIILLYDVYPPFCSKKNNQYYRQLVNFLSSWRNHAFLYCTHKIFIKLLLKSTTFFSYNNKLIRGHGTCCLRCI